MDYFEKLERLRAAYVTLELPYNVTSKEEIRKAYKNLALKHHPDKGGALGAFQKVKAAYDFLEEHAMSDVPAYRPQQHPTSTQPTRSSQESEGPDQYQQYVDRRAREQKAATQKFARDTAAYAQKRRQEKADYEVRKATRKLSTEEVRSMLHQAEKVRQERQKADDEALRGEQSQRQSSTPHRPRQSSSGGPNGSTSRTAGKQAGGSPSAGPTSEELKASRLRREQQEKAEKKDEVAKAKVTASQTQWDKSRGKSHSPPHSICKGEPQREPNVIPQATADHSSLFQPFELNESNCESLPFGATDVGDGSHDQYSQAAEPKDTEEKKACEDGPNPLNFDSSEASAEDTGARHYDEYDGPATFRDEEPPSADLLHQSSPATSAVDIDHLVDEVEIHSAPNFHSNIDSMGTTSQPVVGSSNACPSYERNGIMQSESLSDSGSGNSSEICSGETVKVAALNPRKVAATAATAARWADFVQSSTIESKLAADEPASAASTSEVKSAGGTVESATLPVATSETEEAGEVTFTSTTTTPIEKSVARSDASEEEVEVKLDDNQPSLSLCCTLSHRCR